MAKRVIVRYRVKPSEVAHNEALVRAVYEELHELAPAGLHYATFKLEDGVSFMHVAVHEGPSPLSGLAAFQRFSDGIAERCDEPPVSSQAEEVGAYRAFETSEGRAEGEPAV